MSTLDWYGWINAVCPSACSAATCAEASAPASNRAAPREPAPTDGFTTKSDDGNRAVSPGETSVVGTTARPASSSSARYDLSVFHRTTAAELYSAGTDSHHERNSARRSA